MLTNCDLPSNNFFVRFKVDAPARRLAIGTDENNIVEVYDDGGVSVAIRELN